MFYSVVLALLFILKTRENPANIVTYVRSCYGEQGIKLYRRLEDNQKKLCKITLDLKFLHNCKAHNIVPKFLSFKLYKKCLQNSRLNCKIKT